MSALRSPGGEVRYERALPGARKVAKAREVETTAELAALLSSGAALDGLRLQGLDLTELEARLLQRQDVSGLVVLGGRLSPLLDEHLRTGGAILFPTDPHAPVQPYRGTLYTPDELYDGLREGGYEATTDALAYAWSQDARLRHDAYVTMLRAIHDDAMSDALAGALHGRRVVGVMGGHALARDTDGFARAAELGHRLAALGFLVATGGGPGAMEAANLGAWATDQDELDRALRAVAAVPHFAGGIGPWAEVALGVRAAAATAPQEPRSVGIPTWHYGHEPPNVFADLVAKFFSNALREDLLLHHSTAGLVVLPGAAGTTQEVFQMATRLYYEVEGRVPPLVLVGRDHWVERFPVWPLLQALGHGRAMSRALHLVDTVDEAVAVLTLP